MWYKTEVQIAASARRHGVSDEAIRHVVANAVRVIEADDGMFVIGADPSGRLLEVVGRLIEDDELFVFHAMRLRPVNAKRYLP